MKSIFHFSFSAAVFLLVLWLGRLALPLAAPFLVAMCAAAIMEPAVSALYRRGVSRSIGAGIMTAILLTAAGGLVGGCAVGGAHLVTDYAQRAPALLSAVHKGADALHRRFLVIVQSAPDSLEQDLLTVAEGVSTQLEQLPARLSARALDSAAAVARQSSDWLLFLCTALIGIYFFSLYYQDIRSFLLRQLTQETQEKLRLMVRVTGEAAAGYLKVQCMLSGVTFLILLGAFALMGLEDQFTAAALVSIIDALPVLGAGAALLPWALLSLALGNASRAVGLVLVYGVLLVSRNLLQTRLLGSHLGLHPVVALMSLYAGWKLGGVPGMLLLPVICVPITALHRVGMLHFYR